MRGARLPVTATIRSAQADDLRPLVDLARQTYVAAFGHTFTPDDLAAHLEANLSEACVRGWLDEDTVLLAVAEDRLVGFAHAGPVYPGAFDGLAGPADAALWRLYVIAEFQGSGIGERLLRAALAAPTLASAPNVYLDVWEENLGAQRLYARHGFRLAGRYLLETQSGVGAGYDLILVRAGAGRAP